MHHKNYVYNNDLGWSGIIIVLLVLWILLGIFPSLILSFILFPPSEVGLIIPFTIYIIGIGFFVFSYILLNNKRAIEKDNYSNILKKYDFLSTKNKKKLNYKKANDNEFDAEANSLWNSLNLRQNSQLEDFLEGVYFSDNSYDLFNRFISNTKKTLDITTNVFSDKDLLEILSNIKDKSVKIRIISARHKDKKYSIEKFFADKECRLEIHSCPKNHSKMMIRDGEKMIVGSSNLDKFSFHEALEANVLTSDKMAVGKGISFIDCIIK